MPINTHQRQTERGHDMFQKSWRRLLSSLLAAVLTLSFLPPGTARAADGVSGTLAATLRLDYAQKLEELLPGHFVSCCRAREINKL